MAPTNESTKKKSIGEIFKAAAARALGGGLPGAAAMVIQVLALMWMRTTINYQHSHGVSTFEAFSALYKEGGLGRFYQGLWAALLQAPLSRFGDTAANAGALALLEGSPLPIFLQTFCASSAAALFRIFITPIDTLKTMLQVRGGDALTLLTERVQEHGVGTLYSGALASSLATLMGHYPWFIVYNFLQSRVPQQTGAFKLIRSALIGFCSSAASDTISNSVRVIKTATQTSLKPLTYMEAISDIMASDGIYGLLFRGLTTKIISNGLQAMLFTVCWRYFEEKLADYRKANSTPEKKTE